MGSKSTIPAVRYIKEDALLPQERVFCAEYLANGFNIAAAAAIAWPKAKKGSVTSHGSNVLKRPRVKRYLSKMLHNRLKDAGLSADRLLRKLEAILFLDPLDLFEPGDIDGVYKLKPLDEIPEEVRQCMTELKVKSRTDAVTGDTEVYLEVQLMSKDKAMEMAMKYQGLLVDGAAVNVNVNTSQPRIDFDQLCQPPDLNTIDGVVVS